jgi:hypothetical protein
MYYVKNCVCRRVGIYWVVSWLGKGVKGMRNQLNRINLMTWLIVICVVKNWKEQVRKELLKTEITLISGESAQFIRYCA